MKKDYSGSLFCTTYVTELYFNCEMLNFSIMYIFIIFIFNISFIWPMSNVLFIYIPYQADPKDVYFSLVYDGRSFVARF